MGMKIPGSFLPGSHPDPRAVEAGARVQTADRAARPALRPPIHLDIRETVDSLEKLITRFNRRFQFTVDQQINRIVVKVIDRETDKVIREVPPEEIQHLLARLRETMGLLVDEEI